jgi:hypothetical protein
VSSTIFQRPSSDGALSHLETTEHQRAIREQLERILESPGFRNSKRYPNLLRHVVERALQGRTSDLKERTLGIEVFGRTPDYDPAADPVVRVSAGEIRKRIAQYYHESGHESEIRIDLPLGSYLPEFHFPRSERLAEPSIPLEEPVIIAPARQFGTAALHSRKLLGAAAIALIAIALVSLRPWVRRPSVLDQFWAPVFSPSSRVVLCVGRAPLPPGSMATPERLATRPNSIGWPDVLTLVRLSGLIQSKGQPYQILREDRASFSELQDGPAILIGAFNDAWTLRLMEGMRFGYRQDGAVYWITDRQDPSRNQWKTDLSRQDAEGRPLVNEDYALISRFLNPRTGRIVVIVAGLYGFGTEAAGRLLTDARQMESLAGQVPPQWDKKNLQIVVGTEVIDRSSGPARVLAVHAW